MMKNSLPIFIALLITCAQGAPDLEKGDRDAARNERNLVDNDGILPFPFSLNEYSQWLSGHTLPNLGPKFSKIKVGMTQGKVKDLVGSPQWKGITFLGSPQWNYRNPSAPNPHVWLVFDKNDKVLEIWNFQACHLGIEGFDGAPLIK